MPSLRKPLYPAEAASPPLVVAVTGASGYVAGAVVARLLAAGHTVRGTVRDPGNKKKVAHLLAMPGAAERLTLFKAELTDPTSFDAALAGADAAIHTASPVVMNPPKGREEDVLIKPAVAGVEAVLAAATRAGTVKRVVLTSSIAAVFAALADKGPSHLFSEADWNEASSKDYLPYHASKVAAERRAFEIEAGQTAWTLATILPSVVQGPPAGDIKCESVGFMRKLLNGGLWPAVPGVGMAFVDVDDVAAAHALAAVLPAARGRYIVSAASMTLPEYAALLRPEYGMYKLPFARVPTLVLWFLIRVLRQPLGDWDLIAASSGGVPRLDASKGVADLGLTYIPVGDTARDMAAALIDMGVVRRLPGAPESGAASRL